MAEHDYVIANGTGAAVRADINNALAAVVSNNSKSSDPSTTFAYQWYVDTGDNTLYLRNAANNAWVAVSAVGAIGSANLGLAPAASPTITGTADFDSNTAIKVCDGTTAQRPGSPAVGMFRYNTTTNAFEGYSGSSPAWGEIGGSGGGRYALKLFRDSTMIFEDTYANMRESDGTTKATRTSYTYLDNPADTSAHTYKVALKKESGSNTVYLFNEGANAHTISLYEVDVS